jgi:putative MATE family efflux protein
MAKLLNDKTFWKNTLRIAVPVAIQNLLFSSFTLVDTIFVSRLGDVSLSAVGMASQWSFLMNLVMFGICSGTSVFVSQCWGIKDRKSIHKTLGIALSVAIILSTLFFLFSFAFPRGVISIFNKNTAVLSEGSKYIKSVCFVYPALALSDVLSIVLKSTERAKLPMYTAVVTTALNISLDYCMIFGKLGFSAMGVCGAARATVISSWVGVVFIVLISCIEKNILATNPKNVFSFNMKDLKVFFRKAFPVIINESLWGLGTFVFNVIWANMGYEYYASVTILKTFENMSFVFFAGFSSASSVLIGKSIGKGEIKRGIEDSKRFIFIVPFLSMLVGLTAILLRTQIVNLFDMGNNISELTLQTARMLILIYSLDMPFRMLGFTFIVGVFRSGGDTFSAAKFDLGALWLSAIPATLIAAYVFKLPFLVCYTLMFVFEDFIKLIFSVVHYKKLKWIKPVTQEGKNALKEISNG